MVYEGNNSTPLTLDYLIIQNGTSSSTSSLPTPKGLVGPIVGGVIGGLALLLFAILGFFFLLQRQKREAQEKVSRSTARPFEYTPLHISTSASNLSSGGFPYSQVPQTTKGQVSHAPMPSVTITDSTEPPSTSSVYPTSLRVVPFPHTALSSANPASSSSTQPVPLPSKVEREAEALASVGSQRRGNPSVPTSVQSNDTWLSNANVVLHSDSGIRMPSNTTSTSVVDVPPLYTPD